MYIIGKQHTDQFLVDPFCRRFRLEFFDFDLNRTQLFSNLEVAKKLCTLMKKNHGYDLVIYELNVSYESIWSTE